EAELPELGVRVGHEAVERVVEHRRDQLPHGQTSRVGWVLLLQTPLQPGSHRCGARPTASAAPVGRQQSKRTALLGPETFPAVPTASTTISPGPATLRQYEIVLPPPMAPSSSCCTPLKYTS